MQTLYITTKHRLVNQTRWEKKPTRFISYFLLFISIGLLYGCYTGIRSIITAENLQTTISGFAVAIFALVFSVLSFTGFRKLYNHNKTKARDIMEDNYEIIYTGHLTEKGTTTESGRDMNPIIRYWLVVDGIRYEAFSPEEYGNCHIGDEIVVIKIWGRKLGCKNS